MRYYWYTVGGFHGWVSIEKRGHTHKGMLVLRLLKPPMSWLLWNMTIMKCWTNMGIDQNKTGWRVFGCFCRGKKRQMKQHMHLSNNKWRWTNKSGRSGWKQLCNTYSDRTKSGGLAPPLGELWNDSNMPKEKTREIHRLYGFYKSEFIWSSYIQMYVNYRYHVLLAQLNVMLDGFIFVLATLQ